MRRRRTSEAMTREASTVPQNVAFKDIVQTPTEHQVSAVTVVDSGQGIPST